MSQPIRVTIVTRSLMMGGTQRHIVKLCQELADKDICISLCLLINDEPPDLVSELPSQIKLHIFPYRRHDLRTVFWLAKIVRAEGSQLIHSFSWHADFYASLLKILIPKLVVVTSERGDRGTRSFYQSVHRWIDKMYVFRVVDGVCANSHFGERLLIDIGCNPQKISVIPNGINLSTIDSQSRASLREKFRWPSSSIVVCIVSRLVDYKGLDHFIELVRLCDPNMRFVIIGDGPERQVLSQLVDDLALSDRVVLTGQINPAIPYVKDADVCILPTMSDSEHCSNSILEYMACGKPVIAMNVGGNAELIISELNGFIINPADLDTVPKFLDRLASNTVLAKQMGLAGRKRVEEMFQIKDVAGRFLSLWKSFVMSKGVS